MKKLLLMSSVFVGVGISWANALSVYLDETAFQDALDELTVESFATAPQGTVFQGQRVTLGNLSFRYDGAPDGGPRDPYFGQPLFRPIVGSTSIQFMGEVNKQSEFLATGLAGIHYFDFLDTPVNGFGGYFIGATSGAGLTFQVEGQGSPIPLSTYLGTPGTGFFGVVSDTPFSTVAFDVEASTDPTITSRSEVFSIDSVQYGTITPPQTPIDPSVVPLPAPILFLLSGFAGLFGLRRLQAGRSGATTNAA